MTHPMNFVVALFVIFSLIFTISGRDNYKQMNSMKIYYCLVALDIAMILFNLYATFIK